MFLTVFLCSANYNTLAPQNAASETSVKKKLGRTEIQTQGCWVRSMNTTSVLCNNSPTPAPSVFLMRNDYSAFH